MKIQYVTSLVRLVKDLIELTHGVNDEVAAAKFVVLNEVKNAAARRLKGMQEPFVSRTDAEGMAFDSRGATGKMLTIGNVECRHYDDKDKIVRVADDPQPVAALLAAKGINTKGIIEVTTTVDVKTLEGLVKQGQLTQSDFDGVTTEVKKVTSGKFTMVPIGALKEVLGDLP
jgi:hypothetical protein